jgi:transposase
MTVREMKALWIAANLKLTCQDGVWTVPSQSGNGNYRVTIGEPPTCECDDFEETRGEPPCKHILAARIVAARERGGRAPIIVGDTVPKKPTFHRNWHDYNVAQETEEDRFYDLLSELCRWLVEPDRTGKTGPKPYRMSDMVFIMATKVYNLKSGRRSKTPLVHAHEAGFLSRIPPPTKISSFFERADLRQAIVDLIHQSSLPMRLIETEFGPDSTGFSVSRFTQWVGEKYGEPSGRDWVKAHCIFGLESHIITHVEIGDRDANDCPFFKPLVQMTARNFNVQAVMADKAYLSHDNLNLVDALGGVAYIPFKSNSVEGDEDTVWARMYGLCQFKRTEFMKKYHRRSNAETGFSMVKAKFGDAVRSRCQVAMVNEALIKCLCHNICVVHQAMVELGIKAEFWPDKPARLTAEGLAVA